MSEEYWKARAALDFLLRSSTAEHQALRNCDQAIRRYIERPHVPDEIRRLPNQLKCYMEDCSRMNQDERAFAFGVAIEAVQRAIAKSGGE